MRGIGKEKGRGGIVIYNIGGGEGKGYRGQGCFYAKKTGDVEKGKLGKDVRKHRYGCIIYIIVREGKYRLGDSWGGLF